MNSANDPNLADFIKMMQEYERLPKTIMINPLKVDSAMGLKATMSKILDGIFGENTHKVDFIRTNTALRITVVCEEFNLYPFELDEISALCDSMEILPGPDNGTVNVSCILDDFYIIKN